MRDGTTRREPPGSGATEPVVPGFYPDPTVCRVGRDYYLAHSSFEYFPGVPLFHSRDLVSWTQLGNILDRRSQFRRGDARPSTGIYGSTLRHHDGRFWFITTNMSDFRAGQLLVHAEDPRGPWSEPVFVPAAVGIDPDLCWDGDRCYLTWNALDFEHPQQILQAPLDPHSGRLLAPPYPVWQGSGMPAAEGPHLHRIGSTWYLFLAEGGTERGHCATVARAPHPWGPFEPCPHNPVLTRRSSVHPVQNAGHADLVEAPDGSWAAVYLGVRPRGSTPGFHVLGRETFLAGVEWTDGWPVLDEGKYDVPRTPTRFADDFSDDRLHPRWVVPGGEPAQVAARHPLGGLELRPAEGGADGPLCARVRDHVWTADATMARAGTFAVRLDDRHWYALTLQESTVRAQARVGDLRQQLTAVPVTRETVVLRLSCHLPSSRTVPLGHAGPDEIVLSFDDGTGFTELARLDGRYLSTEVASGFTGRMLALGPAETGGRVLSVEYVPHGS
ncbi:family 43 glycosylhydrolase [Streptomyces sp. NPDC090499]|uniref:glycoside hydrolase family 43 protein n=1 Tax=Streptomyces sp. NPDC090499 TaxID=3365965 RepID=UPI00382E4C9D